MAINKKLIHFKTKANFEKEKEAGNILDTSIVFIQDSNLIWTHGTYYCLPNDEVVITDGIEPEDGQEIWIDVSEDSTIYAVPEAPKDGKQYIRQNGNWVEFTGGSSINDAPSDNKTYGRNNGEWTEISVPKNTSELTNDSGFLTSIPQEYITETELEEKDYATNTLVNTKSDKVIEEDGGSGSVTKQLQPNKYYKFGECSNLTITLDAEIEGIFNEYSFEFTSGTTPTVLSVPDSIKWNSGSAPTIEASKTYQISIVNNLALVATF